MAAEKEAAEEASEQKRNNMEYCRVCKDGGDLLCCDSCPSSFHAYCITPRVEELPEAEWYCPRCTCPAPTNRPEKILSWRWIEIPYPDPDPETVKKNQEAEKQKEKEKAATEDGKVAEGEAETAKEEEKINLLPPRKLQPRKEREFFIKWKYMSYWHCTWVNEMVLELHHAQTLRMYWRKMDPEVCYCSLIFVASRLNLLNF